MIAVVLWFVIAVEFSNIIAIAALIGKQVDITNRGVATSWFITVPVVAGLVYAISHQAAWSANAIILGAVALEYLFAAAWQTLHVGGATPKRGPVRALGRMAFSLCEIAAVAFVLVH